MPVDYKKYPSNWFSEIRPKILSRSEHRCEKCKVKDRTWVSRGIYNDDKVYQYSTGEIHKEDNGNYVTTDFKEGIWSKSIKIVLTIAHLDQNVENNNESNLKALCQKCHLNHDRNDNRKKYRNTFNLKRSRSEFEFKGEIQTGLIKKANEKNMHIL